MALARPEHERRSPPDEEQNFNYAALPSVLSRQVRPIDLGRILKSTGSFNIQTLKGWETLVYWLNHGYI